MSDLLICGMEMPTCGATMVLVFPNGNVYGMKYGSEKWELIGQAIDLPPHRRLIDADALYEDCALDHNYEIAATTTRINEYMQLKIDAAPTIIPASE